MQTDRFGLPLLAAGQAQKEMTHNEALTMLDLAIALTVERDDLSAPPSSPGAGLCWIIADGASGEWSGREGQIAGWTDAGWRFLLPRAGMRALAYASWAYALVRGRGMGERIGAA